MSEQQTMEEWITRSDTANNRMEHDFGNGYLVVVDFNHNRLYKLHNGDPKDSMSISGITPEDYYHLLTNIKRSLY